jgi:hypothetical protein
MDFTLQFLRIFFLDLGYAAPLLISLLMLIAVIGYIIGWIEGWSPGDALYHAFINATTVGYGDFRPTHGRTKVLAILLALTGLVFTGMVVAIALHAAHVTFEDVYHMGGLNSRQRL